MTWPARAVFVLLVGATFAAFFAAQRLKGAPPVAQVAGLAPFFSPNGDGRRDANRFRVRLRESDAVAVDVVDEAGDAVRRLADGVPVGADEPLRLTWDGRTDGGGRAPDGPYRMRVTLRQEGRSVVVPRTTIVDTRPPRPRVRRIDPAAIVGPEPGPVRIHFGAVSASAPTRLRIFRTDRGEPREVARLRQVAGKRSVEWDADVPRGLYLVQITTRDRAGNLGSTPVEVPPPTNEQRGEPGLTVRTIAAEPPLRPVTAGERVTINVDARRRPYRWRLRRVGRSIPVRTGRERAGEPIELTAPSGDSGLYLLELRANPGATAVPLVVQSRRRADVLVVVPALTWVGTDPVDQDVDGMPATLDRGVAVNWPRVLAHGLPADLRERVAPLLLFLDRAGVRYDLTTDLDLILSRAPRASDREGVLLAGAERWITRPYARRLRRYVADGGRVASFGVESLRRGVTVLRNDEHTAGRLVRPTQPSPEDPFGTRLDPVRRLEAPAALTPIAGDAGDPLLEGFDGVLAGFSVLEESELPTGDRARVRAALGVETAPAAEEPGVPEELPEPAQPALASTRIGDGLYIRVGLPEWSQRLGDPQVAQLTRNVFDLLRGAEPRIRD